VAWVSWKYCEDNVASGKNVNVAFAAYVTTQARVELDDYLSKLGQFVLYCDTDCVFYVQNVDEPPKVTTVDYLSDLTDGLEEFDSGSFIDQGVSGDRKSMGFR